MLPFVKSLLPRLKQYSKNLDQTSIFIDKPWIMIDENKDQHHYVFHKDGRLIMSLNGSVQIGKWEFLAGSNSLLIDRIKDSMLLNQEFIEDGLMFLKKDGLKDHFFILINKNVIPDLDYEKYLKKCFINLKDLRKFASNNQKSYYATSLYSDSQYTNQSRYQSSVGDEIFDENLEAVHSETIINDGKSMAVINGKIGSVYYERNYETDENLSLKIRQSSNDRLTIGDIVLDENKNPVSGTFKFKPHILEKVNLISVMDGTIFTIKKEIKKKSKFFWIALTGTLITFTVFFIYYISSLPPGKNVQVTTWADIGASGSVNITDSKWSSKALAVDAAGNVYVTVADTFNNLIRKISPTGKITILAGSGVKGSDNGKGTAASFNSPSGVAVDINRNVYVADNGNHLIRKISPAGVVTTLAGSGAEGSSNGKGAAASFSYLYGVSVDVNGNVYVADAGNHLIRKISPAGVVTTLGGSGEEGSSNGKGTSASFDGSFNIAVAPNGTVYVAEWNNDLIRKISPTGLVTTLAGSGFPGSDNDTGISASFFHPTGIAVDAAGNVYVADSDNNLIREISPTGLVTKLAGSGTYNSENGNGTTASFWGPSGIAVDINGNVYVVSEHNTLIRKISQKPYLKQLQVN